MKFDIALKVVKFNNGQFGIRRWTWIGYQFLDMDHDNDHWWLTKEYVSEHAVGTEEKVRARLAAYRMPKVPMIPGFDRGTPV